MNAIPKWISTFPSARTATTIDRYLIRVQEMRESLKIMKQCVEAAVVGEGQGPVSSTDGKSCRQSAAR